MFKEQHFVWTCARITQYIAIFRMKQTNSIILEMKSSKISNIAFSKTVTTRDGDFRFFFRIRISIPFFESDSESFFRFLSNILFFESYCICLYCTTKKNHKNEPSNNKGITKTKNLSHLQCRTLPLSPKYTVVVVWRLSNLYSATFLFALFMEHHKTVFGSQVGLIRTTVAYISWLFPLTIKSCCAVILSLGMFLGKHKLMLAQCTCRCSGHWSTVLWPIHWKRCLTRLFQQQKILLLGKVDRFTTLVGKLVPVLTCKIWAFTCITSISQWQIFFHHATIFIWNYA